MREAELRSRIRDLLSTGILPRQLPAEAQMDPRLIVASPHIRVGVQAAEPCFVCGEAKPMVSYTYPDGRVIPCIRACDYVWHEEREQT